MFRDMWCVTKRSLSLCVFRYLTLLFYIAVALYIPTRYRVMAARDFEEEETTADAVIRYYR